MFGFRFLCSMYGSSYIISYYPSVHGTPRCVQIEAVLIEISHPVQAGIPSSPCIGREILGRTISSDPLNLYCGRLSLICCSPYRKVGIFARTLESF